MIFTTKKLLGFGKDLMLRGAYNIYKRKCKCNKS